MILLLTITVNRAIIVTVKSKQQPREGGKDHTMKTYELKAYELTYSDGRGNYSALVVIAESAEQAAAYYTVEQGANVITCTATAWPAPEQPRGYVPLDWVAPAAETETTETAAEPAERAEKENTMKYIDTTKTPAVEVETTERVAEIADALHDIRRERVAYGYSYRTKQRVTARCIREAEQAGRPTVRVGYCDLDGVLSGIEPDYYTAGVYGWNCDVYVIAGLAICTGYRPAAGVRAVGVRELADACRGADAATRDRLLAAWIVTNREMSREGARA